MKKLTVSLTAFIWLYVSAVNAQQGVAINTTGSVADSKSILDISSTTKGMLIPRMTAAQPVTIRYWS